MVQIRAASRFAVVSVITVLFVSARADAQHLFDHINYEGESYELNTIESEWLGDAWNDRVSSARVNPGFKLELFEHSNFGGAKLTLLESRADLRNFAGPGPDGTWNDVASSYRYVPLQTSELPSFTIVVNGTSAWDPDWIQLGSPFMSAIAATYGRPPQRHIWHQNSIPEVTIATGYWGIMRGAEDFATYVNALGLSPDTQFNAVGFSHGGNVIHLGAWLLNRRIDHMVSLATPHNWDVRYGIIPYTRQYGRHCAAWSYMDEIQLPGSSPLQFKMFYDHTALSAAYFNLGWDAYFTYNDVNLALFYYYRSLDEAAAAWDWWVSAREDPAAYNVRRNTGLHSSLHTPDVWNSLPSFCKTN